MTMSYRISSWALAPNLCSLNIGRLKKPILEWGPQNFSNLTCNYTYTVEDHQKDVRNFSRLSHLLPSSLTSLTIFGFKKLEYVQRDSNTSPPQPSTHLPLPKEKDLPDMLLPSLFCLTICHCPNLEERCSRRGSYWLLAPHLSYPPSIHKMKSYKVNVKVCTLKQNLFKMVNEFKSLSKGLQHLAIDNYPKGMMMLLVYAVG